MEIFLLLIFGSASAMTTESNNLLEEIPIDHLKQNCETAAVKKYNAKSTIECILRCQRNPGTISLYNQNGKCYCSNKLDCNGNLHNYKAYRFIEVRY